MMKNLNKNRSYIAAALVLVLTVTMSLTALAQDNSPGTRPYMYGHGFIESVHVPSPFVRSFIRNRLGGGIGYDLATPPTGIGGVTIPGFEGNLLFAILDFEYQYAIKPWVAARGRIMANGRLGSDTLSMLSEGVTMSTGFEFGWLFRLHERERTALSLDLTLANRAFTAMNIVRFVEDIIDDNPASLVSKTPSARGGAGLRFSWAASPLLGVSANGKTGFGESLNRSEKDVWFWNFAGAVDFDFRANSNVPMGLALGYVYDTFPEFGEGIGKGVNTFFMRVSYLGREDFLLSLDVSYDTIPIGDDLPNLKALTFTIGFRYYI